MKFSNTPIRLATASNAFNARQPLAAWLSAVLLAAVAGAAQAAESPSALGVGFGLTPPQVAAKLGAAAKLMESGKANISYDQARKVLQDSDYLAVERYEITNAGLTAQQVRDEMKVFYSPDFKNEKVIGLTREQFFSDGFRPQPKLRTQDYIDKFGKPSFAGPNGYGGQALLWTYEENGSLRASAHPEAVRHCAGTFLESRSVLEVMRRPMPNLPSAAVCGAATMRIDIALDPQGSVMRLYFSMMDYKRIFESLDALEARIQKTEADAAKIQIDRTKNRPAL